MHVHAHIEGMHVDARTPSLACLRMRLLVSSTEQLSAFVCFYRGMSVYLHIIGCMRLSACGSRAEHLLACFKSGVCIFIQLPVLRAQHVPACSERMQCLHVPRLLAGFES